MSPARREAAPKRSRVRRVDAPLQLDAAVSHDGATRSGPALSFTTPAARWAYAVSVPVVWPPAAHWVHERDGLLRIQMGMVEGRLSILAVDSAGTTVIDETVVDSCAVPFDVDLVSAPLGACATVTFRNARSDGQPSRAHASGAEAIDLGPAPLGDDLDAPAGLALRPVDDWARYYGSPVSLEDRRRRARYNRLDHVKRMPWLSGLTVNVYPNDDLSRALYISGLYEPAALLLLQRVLGPGATFIDAGANVGLFSLLASRWVGETGRVLACEPSRREHARLVEHMALNRTTNITPLRYAIGSREGTAQLRVAAFPNAGHNTLGASFAYDTVLTEAVETVEVVSLDRLVRMHQLTRVDAIKMDIEGSEYAALVGARLLLDEFRPVVILESSRAALANCGTTPELVMALLGGARYAVHRIAPNGELLTRPLGDVALDENIVAVPVEGQQI